MTSRVSPEFGQEPQRRYNFTDLYLRMYQVCSGRIYAQGKQALAKSTNYPWAQQLDFIAKDPFPTASMTHVQGHRLNGDSSPRLPPNVLESWNYLQSRPQRVSRRHTPPRQLLPSRWFGLVTAIIGTLSASFVDSKHHFYLYHDDSIELNADNARMAFFKCRGTRRMGAGLASQRFTCKVVQSSSHRRSFYLHVVTRKLRSQQVFIVFNNGRMRFATCILMLGDNDSGLVPLLGRYAEGKYWVLEAPQASFELESQIVFLFDNARIQIWHAHPDAARSPNERAGRNRVWALRITPDRELTSSNVAWCLGIDVASLQCSGGREAGLVQWVETNIDWLSLTLEYFKTLFAEATSPDLHHSLSVIVASAVYVTLTKGDWEDRDGDCVRAEPVPRNLDKLPADEAARDVEGSVDAGLKTCLRALLSKYEVGLSSTSSGLVEREEGTGGICRRNGLEAYRYMNVTRWWSDERRCEKREDVKTQRSAGSHGSGSSPCGNGRGRVDFCEATLMPTDKGKLLGCTRRDKARTVVEHCCSAREVGILKFVCSFSLAYYYLDIGFGCIQDRRSASPRTLRITRLNLISILVMIMEKANTSFLSTLEHITTTSAKGLCIHSSVVIAGFATHSTTWIECALLARSRSPDGAFAERRYTTPLMTVNVVSSKAETMEECAGGIFRKVKRARYSSGSGLYGDGLTESLEDHYRFRNVYGLGHMFHELMRYSDGALCWPEVGSCSTMISSSSTTSRFGLHKLTITADSRLLLRRQPAHNYLCSACVRYLIDPMPLETRRMTRPDSAGYGMNRVPKDVQPIALLLDELRGWTYTMSNLIDSLQSSSTDSAGGKLSLCGTGAYTIVIKPSLFESRRHRDDGVGSQDQTKWQSADWITQTECARGRDLGRSWCGELVGVVRRGGRVGGLRTDGRQRPRECARRRWRDAYAERKDVDGGGLFLAWTEVGRSRGGQWCGCEGGRAVIYRRRRAVDGHKFIGTGRFVHEGGSTGIWREFIGTGHFVHK
ncbi:hypothetical protein EDD18DRAFT_1383399 [Armillaria luteobubalina]|uniref:Uncharacterized protein n=1 Tax=Armillaria luteobubalina TaxID=153913 RepID=A0AA39P2V8_9AGAR|nr:hypothetical protein EDD18DRAFT_1383399 [Armillaria luteobubalina]